MSGNRDYMTIVRGLLAKAEATDNPGEAEAFMEGAQRIMTEHAIDEAMVNRDRRDRTTVETVKIICDAPYAKPKGMLLTQLAKNNDCRSAWFEPTKTVTVMGYRGDLDHVEALYTSLSMQATTTMMSLADNGRKFRRSFLIGFATRIGQRLERARDQARTHYESQHTHTEGSVALVLADKRQLVNDAFEAAFPNLKNARISVSSRDGIAAGARAADRADVGHGQLRSRRALPRT